MADTSTFITGSAPGSLEEAFGKLPPWATQHTSAIIARHLEKSLGVQKDIFSKLKECCDKSGAGGSIDVDELNDELDDLSENLRRASDNQRESNRLTRERNNEEKKGASTTKSFIDNLKKGSFWAEKLAIAGGKVIGVMGNYVDSYDAIYKSGINVLNGSNDTVDGFEALNQMVRSTGLNLATLTKTATEYSSTLNVVGMTKFAKSIEMAKEGLISVGFSSEEHADLLATMLESQRGYSDIRHRTDTQLMNDAIKLGSNFRDLSLMVGMSREQLKENLKATSKSTDSTLVAALYGIEAAEAVSSFTSTIDDPGLRDSLASLAATDSPQNTQFFRTLVEGSMPELANQLANLMARARGQDAETTIREFKNIMDNVKQGQIADLARLRVSSGPTAGQAGATADAVNKMLQAARGVSEAKPSTVTDATKTEAAIATFQTETMKLGATLEATFLPTTGQVKLLGESIGVVNTEIEKLTGAFDSATRSIVGAGVMISGAAATLASKLGLPGLGGGAGGGGGGGGGAGAGRLLKGAGALAAAGIGWEIGWTIGTEINDSLKDKDWFRDGADSFFGFFDEILNFSGTKGKAAGIADKPLGPKDLSLSKDFKLSGPSKTPPPSTIKSPSAVPAPPAKESLESDPGLPNTRKGTSAADSVASEARIAAAIEQQTATMNKLLENSDATLSAQKEMVRLQRGSQ